MSAAGQGQPADAPAELASHLDLRSTILRATAPPRDIPPVNLIERLLLVQTWRVLVREPVVVQRETW